MSEELPQEKNVLGGPLLACSYDPGTGYFRDGCCSTHGQDGVAHLVCVRVTADFLEFSRERGNDLSTPRPEMRFRGPPAGARRGLGAPRAGRCPERAAPGVALPRAAGRRPLVPARAALGRGVGGGHGAPGRARG